MNSNNQSTAGYMVITYEGIFSCYRTRANSLAEARKIRRRNMRRRFTTLVEIVPIGTN